VIDDYVVTCGEVSFAHVLPAWSVC